MCESIDELVEEVDNLVSAFLENGKRVSPEKLGLDRRAGWELWVSNARDCIGVEGQSANQALRYYGGFEYITDENVRSIGNWTFYLAEDCSRVHDALALLDDPEGEE